MVAAGGFEPPTKGLLQIPPALPLSYAAIGPEGAGNTLSTWAWPSTAGQPVSRGLSATPSNPNKHLVASSAR